MVSVLAFFSAAAEACNWFIVFLDGVLASVSFCPSPLYFGFLCFFVVVLCEDGKGGKDYFCFVWRQVLIYPQLIAHSLFNWWTSILLPLPLKSWDYKSYPTILGVWLLEFKPMPGEMLKVSTPSVEPNPQPLNYAHIHTLIKNLTNI